MIFKENIENACFFMIFIEKPLILLHLQDFQVISLKKHAGFALKALIFMNPYVFASTIFMNEPPGLVGLFFWIVCLLVVLGGCLVSDPMVFDNCFNHKLGCARLIWSELNSMHQIT